MSATFSAVVSEDGKRLHWEHEDAKSAYIAKFAADEILVTIRRRPRTQGTQQLKYYRGVVIPDIADASGYTDPDDYAEVHDAMAWKFLRLPDGQFGQPRRRSTAKSDLSLEEMTRYIDQVILWAETSIPGCRVRRPEEVDIDRVVDQEFV